MKIQDITRFLLLLSTLSIVAPLGAIAQEEIVVIVNEAVPVEEISSSDLRDIFLGNRSLWENASKIQACYIIDEEEVEHWLFDEVIEMSFSRFKKHWLKKVFSGYGSAPDAFRSAKKAVDFIQGHDGGIGVIPKSALGTIEGVRVIAVNP